MSDAAAPVPHPSALRVALYYPRLQAFVIPADQLAAQRAMGWQVRALSLLMATGTGITGLLFEVTVDGCPLAACVFVETADTRITDVRGVSGYGGKTVDVAQPMRFIAEGEVRANGEASI